ncbi:MAG: nitrate reductase [bacterium]|nr:nitrate reductase [bacterium]
MTVLPYAVAYVGILVFIIAVIARFIMWSRMPMHVRWELYPVAHEGGGRAKYGGSYLEESEWWKKPRQVSLWGEIKVMVPEIMFLVALKEHNSKLWTRSFPFHFGLYLVGTATALMIFGGVVAGIAPQITDLIGRVLPFLGVAGLVLGLLGAIGLFLRRRGRELKDYTAPADLLNLIFFVIAFGCALATFFLVDRDFALVYFFVQNLVTFQIVALPGSGLAAILPVLSIVLLALLTAYIPLTHMSHFVGKYFAYHSIRWNDEPNLKGGSQEKTIQGLLNQPVTWAAPHIKGEGKKTWLDIAIEDMPEDESK